MLRSEVATLSAAPPGVTLAALTAKAGFMHWVTGHNVHEEPVGTHVDRAAARAALQKSASGDRAASSLSSRYQQLDGVIDA